ncbi:unnamed protein product [Darwinula stevensoni]|uniref:Amino acid transporter transmembrane domain-containing protein n=1 Tax=Darwinula stevensoni TaxID=69355 RepID=A0A7R9FQ97_9CRUS|nr:unnamed protein product [Darwinula stevensoni]CAG0899359.1 unnamed protein product [Darwinula stevensoni]
MLFAPCDTFQAGVMEGITVMSLVACFSIKAMLMIIDCKYELIRNRRIRPASTNGHIGVRMRNSRIQLSNGQVVSLKLPLLSTGDSEGEDVDDDGFMVANEFSPEYCTNYGDIGYHAIGYTGRGIVDLTLIVSQVGFCCAYLIFITENLSGYFPSLSKPQWLVLLLPPLFLLTLLKRLDKLAIFSLLAQISNLFAFAVVFWFDFEHIHVSKFHPREFSWKGFPFYFAVSIYCYEGQGLILPLEESLNSSIRTNFRKYFVSTMVAVTCLYITFGASGYLSFGPETKEIITMNLPHTGELDFAMLVKSCLCFSLFFTYPVMMFPVLQLIDSRCSALEGALQSVIVRLLLVSCTGIVVLAIPNFAHLMALIGATCCTLLAFVLPAIFHLRIFSLKLTKLQRWFDYWLIVMGIAGACLGTVDALARMNAQGAHPRHMGNFSPLPEALASGAEASVFASHTTESVAHISNVIQTTLLTSLNDTTLTDKLTSLL